MVVECFFSIYLNDCKQCFSKTENINLIRLKSTSLTQLINVDQNIAGYFEQLSSFTAYSNFPSHLKKSFDFQSLLHHLSRIHLCDKSIMCLNLFYCKFKMA